MADKLTSGIYQIKNINDGSIYIGSSVNIRKRWNLHRTELRQNVHHNSHLQNAWNKYGEIFFEFAILQEVTNLEELIALEQRYLDEFRPAYNICKIAGSPLGRITSEETKAKLRMLHKGKKRSDKAKENMRKAQRDKGLTDEHKAKLSEAAKKRKWSDETKKKISLSTKGQRNKAKLTWEQVAIIRKMINENIALIKIANIYKVSRRTINAIKLGEAWKIEVS